MKRLERLLEKLAEVLDVSGMTAAEVGELLISLALMLFYEGLGIWIAVVAQNYFILSISTFLWVWIIVECFINKIFFEKLDNYLLETTKATNLVCWIIFIIAMILSWNHFVGFILTTILAFIIGDFKKIKRKNNK